MLKLFDCSNEADELRAKAVLESEKKEKIEEKLNATNNELNSVKKELHEIKTERDAFKKELELTTTLKTQNERVQFSALLRVQCLHCVPNQVWL